MLRTILQKEMLLDTKLNNYATLVETIEQVKIFSTFLCLFFRC